VPPAHEGKGVAGALVRAALAYARARDLRVLPACSYVRSYMQHHPETHDLLPPGTAL
ncbi:MAG TPA: N-acetyltransferase, partial [Casimicrobiaceae bacterium]